MTHETHHGPPAPRRYDRVKRWGDVVVAGGALLLLSPVMLGTAIAVRVALGPGVLFRQRRPGKDGKAFEILKFRSMLPMDPEKGIVSDARRLTPFGRALRATSLDELPELVNVVRGDMSLVGPRPLLTSYLDLYSEEQSRRHDVRPGLTGLAQVSGRNAVSWDDRLQLDVEYVQARSLCTDLRILLATVPAVLRREGVVEAGSATRSSFHGPRRIGAHQIRAAASARVSREGAGTRWEVVDRGSDELLATCTLVERGDDELVPDVHVLPGVEDPRALRAHAMEMLHSIARERGRSLVDRTTEEAL